MAGVALRCPAESAGNSFVGERIPIQREWYSREEPGGQPITAVSARLGHAHSAITGSIYAHAIKGQDQQAADAIGRVLRG